MTCASSETDDIDVLLRLLANSYRRTLLQVLVSGPTRQPLGDVVNQVVAESPAGDHRFPDVGQVATELHHKHLPVVREHGFVDYDHEQNTVTYHPSDDLESLLEFLDELESDARQ